jgi:cyclophilin family peptidyl-prolyl cis-trans isomerase/HEAT repeat protein
MKIRMKRWLVLIALQGCTCNDNATPAPDAAPEAGLDLSALGRAEDSRKSADVPAESLTSRDVRVRRRAVRALARIADDGAVPGLNKALEDEDPETTAWAAYGLGLACKGREETVVKALAARGAALDASLETAATPAIDPRFAIARAMGRCGGPLAEQTLAGWARAGHASADAACFALGDVASRRGTLGDDTVTSLLEAAERGRGAAFHPLSRMDRLNDAFSSRIIAAARTVTIAKAADDRAFAIRALGASGPDAAPDLESIVSDGSRDVMDRIQAGRALAKIGEGGRASAATALAKITPSKDPLAVAALGGAQLHVMTTLLAALGTDPPKSVEPTLYAIAGLTAPGTPPASLARRLGTLRCTAAGLLAKGAYDSKSLESCDDPNTMAWEQARLASLLKRPLTTPDRKKAWTDLTKSKNLRVREAALEAIGSHAEIPDPLARAAIADALSDVAHAGVVATAAEIVHAHPERFLALSPKEIKKALDPKAPLNPNPEQELDALVGKALETAITNAWAEDLVETRVALLDAAVAVHAPKALERAKAACADSNLTVRDRAAIALRALGEPKAACPPPAVMPVAKDLGPPKATKLKFSTDAGDLTIVLDGDLAPIMSARVVELAKSGFYKGIVCHRVVPGFVVQFGDPAGDGYGGSGTIVRSETSPKPYNALDVGVALAGRDTGSSQLFVTLARYPHLDGEYPLIGHAEGDWAAVAEGDAILDVLVTE